jgi:hypothetical protein
MRHLLQPRVLRTASIAAAVGTLACYPELSLWLRRPGPIWYLEASIFIGSIILWGFVFAWHVPYTGHPVFSSRLEPRPFIAATLIAVVTAVIFHIWLDPSLRPKFPEEYPSDFQHWLASVLFVLTFSQLFLIFAPFDWLLRLFKNRWVAATLLAVLGTALLAMKIRKESASLPPQVLALLFGGRVMSGFLLAALYWRGGVVLVGWWSLLLQCRFLLDYAGHPGLPGS